MDLEPRKRQKLADSLNLFVYSIETVRPSAKNQYDHDNTLRCFCRDEENKSALLIVTGFKHYFYADADSVDHWIGRHSIDAVDTKVRQELDAASDFGPKRYKVVSNVEETQAEDIMYYKPDPNKRQTRVYKISLANWCDMWSVAKVFSQRMGVWEASGIPYELRFMIDMGLRGCSWVRLSDRYITNAKTFTTCANEYVISYDDITALEPEQEWAKLPTLGILSFDIECR